MVIGYRREMVNGTEQVWFVADTPHPKGSKPAIRHGVDWGYSTKREQAIDLSHYWQLRFAKDCSRVNRIPGFVTC